MLYLILGKVLFRYGWLDVTGKIQRRGPKSLSIIAGEVRPLRRGRPNAG